MPTIRLPNGWLPRGYQRPLWDALETGTKRAIEIAHRRWGKDDLVLHRTAIAAHERVASYWHCLPEYAQARKALWTAVNPHSGKRRIDEAFPRELRDSTDEQAMFIRFKNGSTWQLIGSDNYNSLVGAGVAGVVFSEWALANPSSWGYIRPMVEENNGWAVFITTPRGNNHAKAMLDMARRNPAWFAEVSTIHDTQALTPDQLAEARAEYAALYGEEMGRAQYEQEYECSFNAAILGAYFGAEMARAEREGRICTVERDPSQPVHTVWDLGKAVNNPIWCFQVVNGELLVIDFYRPETDDLKDWCQWLNDRGYHGTDYVPHDVLVTEWGTNKTRLDMLRLHGRKPQRVARVSVADGQQAGRIAINAARFDAERCALGVEGLKAYRRDWDDELKRFSDNPVKDWAEHIGSAWRYLGLAWREVLPKAPPPPPKDRLVYEARPDGSVVSNLTVREAVEAMVKRRRRDG